MNNRKPGVPSRKEMYIILKRRSEELKSELYESEVNGREIRCDDFSCEEI